MYAGFHYKILPLRSGAWRFCSEPSGYNLAYNKDITKYLYDTIPILGRPKVDMLKHVGVCSVRMCVKVAMK